MSVAVTRAQFVEMVRKEVKGTDIITVDYDSPMDGKGKMAKTGNPFFGMGMVKRGSVNGVIGYVYANAVNKIASKEGKEERQAKRHPWGDMDDKNQFRIHRTTGELYLSMMVKSATVHGFFMPNGEQLNSDDVYAFISDKSKSSTQADLKGEVVARDIKIDSIRSVRMWGQEYEVVADPMIEQAQEKDKTEVAAGVTVGV